MRIVLASSSPRRKELLKKMGLDFSIRPSDICEDIGGVLSPEVLTMTLAEKKAQAVFKEGEIVLGADTVVVFEGKTFGKPHTVKEATDMLMSLSGRRHSVITGICLYSNDRIISTYCKSFVEFEYFGERDIKQYIVDGKSFDKAGGYNIQDEEIKKITKYVEGSYDNIAGLPTELLEKILGENF